MLLRFLFENYKPLYSFFVMALPKVMLKSSRVLARRGNARNGFELNLSLKDSLLRQLKILSETPSILTQYRA